MLYVYNTCFSLSDLFHSVWQSISSSVSLQMACHSFLWLSRIIKKATVFQKNIYFCFIDYTKALDCVDHNKLWEIIKEMGIPDHLTCLLRNLYASQEATVRTRHGTTDWFQIWKKVHQGCICHPVSSTYMQSISCKMLSLMKHKLESRLPG